MQILFVSATGQELSAVKTHIKTYHHAGVHCDFFCTGMGNYETIYALTKYLSDLAQKGIKYDFVVNIGICGYTKSKPDLIQIARIFSISTQKEHLVPIFFEFAPLQSIACGERPALNEQELCGESYIDMESFAVEYVANKLKIPRLLLKVPIDRVGAETQTMDYKSAIQTLQKNIDRDLLLKKIIYFGAVQ